MGNSNSNIDQKVQSNLSPGSSTVPPGSTPIPPDLPPQEIKPAFPDNPGTMEELHAKNRDLVPEFFDGAKITVNKMLSQHFQISHNISMIALSKQPSKYKFGATYVGFKSLSPGELYPVLQGEIEPNGDMVGNCIYYLTKRLRIRHSAQIVKSQCKNFQSVFDYRLDKSTISVAVVNPDILDGSAVILTNYLHAVTPSLSLGTELMFQRNKAIPGKQMSIFSLAGKYSTPNWELSCNVTPMALGIHTSYFHRISDQLKVGAEMQISAASEEGCTTTVSYQYDLPETGFTFKGHLDNNLCLGCVLDKRLDPLPFTLSLSGYGNQLKQMYMFGIGLTVGGMS